jgi:glutathionylspermidine synthase
LNVYPKELLISEIEHDDLLSYDLKNLDFIEPVWKLILGNKALMPLLWEMFPGHPNLLPAYQDSPKIYFHDKYKEVSIDWVSKPLFGREGNGIF